MRINQKSQSDGIDLFLRVECEMCDKLKNYYYISSAVLKYFIQYILYEEWTVKKRFRININSCKPKNDVNTKIKCLVYIFFMLYINV